MQTPPAINISSRLFSLQSVFSSSSTALSHQFHISLQNFLLTYALTSSAMSLIRRRHRSHYHHHRQRPSIATVTALVFLLFSSSSAVSLYPTRQLGAGTVREEREEVVTRRRLSGPGSSPPTCSSKCGRCAPCKPVHVPIKPGLIRMPLEYYPEAWRCKCGNDLFMP